MAVHKTCRGLLETAVTIVPKFRCYNVSVHADVLNHCADYVRTKPNQNVVQRLRSALPGQSSVTKQNTKHGMTQKTGYKTGYKTSYKTQSKKSQQKLKSNNTYPFLFILFLITIHNVISRLLLRWRFSLNPLRFTILILITHF